jgi:hypothetical protein
MASLSFHYEGAAGVRRADAHEIEAWPGCAVSNGLSFATDEYR